MSKKYKDDYKIKQIEKEDGSVEEQYIYVGTYYLNNMSEIQKRHLTLSAFVFSLLNMWLFFVSGFFDNAGGRCIYVMLPYICIFLPAAYFVLASFNVWLATAQLTREKYDKSFGRCIRMPKCMIVLSGITIVCDGIFLLVNRTTSNLENELLFMGFLVLIAVINIIFLKYNKNSFGCIKIQE